jgi:hypothetical protein
MITLIFGIPGSGKTYWAVHTIRKKCLQESDIFFRVKDDVLLITNLRLRLDEQEGYIYIENWEDWLRFLNVRFWQENLNWWSGKKVWLIMDECQRFFYLAKENPEVWFYLQYHRHLSHNLIFITQTPKSIPGKLFELCEYLIEAVPKSISITSLFAFRYRVLSPLDKSLVLRRFHLKHDPVTFYLYTDMIYNDDEGLKPSNAFLRPIAFLGLTVLGVFLSLHLFFSSFGSKIQAQVQNTRTTQTQTQKITYEDLINEEPKSKQQEPQQKQQEMQEPPKQTDYYTVEKTPNYYYTVEKTRPKAETIELSPGPKIIYLP